MMQVSKLNFVITFLFYAVIAYSCNHNTKESTTDFVKDSVILDNKYYYPKIDYLVNQFNRQEENIFYQKKMSYPIEDSLCLYFSKLNKKELIGDDEFRYMAGKLLEKAYLEVRNSGMFPPESFPVYNMDLYPIGNRQSHYFALKIILQNTTDINSDFIQYSARWTDFLCIDSVVLVLDKLPQMQNDSNHQKCIELVRNNKTGGCKW